MGRRYSGWRELKIHSEYNRRRVVKRQRILFGVGIGIILVLLICGGVFLWQRFHKEDAKTVTNQELNAAKTPEPTVNPTETPTEAPTEEPLKELVEENLGCLVLDAGHGGKDGGTFNGDILEKDINLAVVQYIKEALEEANIEVILTRSTDDFLDVPERSDFANQKEADLFVSIHCNFFEDDASVSGLECYYYEENKGGQAFAESMIEVLKENKDIKVRSAKHGNYYVLKYTEMPSILVELGFLSNNAESEKLNSADYQELLAEEIAKGILLQFTNESEKVEE